MFLAAFLEGGRRRSTPGMAEPVGVSPPKAVDSIRLREAIGRIEGILSDAPRLAAIDAGLTRLRQRGD